MDPNDLEAHLRDALKGAYDIQRELPGGGMSRVFVAVERSLNRTVVIKVLPPELAAGVNRERFQREIQLAAQLQHPHIVPLFSEGEHGELLYYTMPYIDGESLKHAIAAKTYFTVRDVVRILRDVSDALAYAHARGVAHRDIKPGNILRTAGHALVTDFGVAKALSLSLPGVGSTTSGMAIGTPAYMAPEQLAGDPAADTRVDIYAVGLLAYELLLGESPFFSSSPQETMARQLTRDPDPISKRRADVPVPLAALISRCLAKTPEARPQTAAQLVAELDSLVTVSGDFTPRSAEKSRSTAVMVGVAAIVVITGLSAYAWASRNDGEANIAPVAPPAVAAPPQLTHADSVAIARAVDQKVAERRAADARADSIRRAAADSAGGRAKAAPAVSVSPEALKKITDSLRSEMMHAVLDSVTKMQALAALGRGVTLGRGPGGISVVRPPFDSTRVNKTGTPGTESFATRAANPGPPRRMFISTPRALPGVGGATTALNMASAVIMDSLRNTLSRKPRYIVLSRDSVAAMLAVTRQTDSLAKLTHAELFASLLPQMAAGFVTWQVTLRDLTASGAYTIRTIAVRVPADSMLAGTDSIVARSVRMFDEIDRAPRKATPPPG